MWVAGPVALNVTKVHNSSLNHGSKSGELAWLVATALHNQCKCPRHLLGAAVSVASSSHTPSGHRKSRWHCSRHSRSAAAIDAAADERRRNTLNSSTACAAALLLLPYHAACSAIGRATCTSGWATVG